ncbi:unnamed protein product [Hapterophycus canaliculatus]
MAYGIVADDGEMGGGGGAGGGTGRSKQRLSLFASISETDYDPTQPTVRHSWPDERCLDQRSSQVLSVRLCYLQDRAGISQRLSGILEVRYKRSRDGPGLLMRASGT